jgi:autotransporter translocation and assembly factor TamB
MPRSRRQRIAAGLLRAIVLAVLFLLIVAGAALTALETGWGKNQLRDLIVRQANQYLTARLEIDRLEGSLLRGVELAGIRLSRDGRTLIRIERVGLSYSIRELIEGGTSIRRLRVVRPFVAAARQADGRWDLAALVRREARQQERTGPRRPIHILSIEVVDGTIELADELRFGAAHLPTRFSALNTTLAFHYEPVTWRLEFDEMSWTGSAPDLKVASLTGGIASGAAGVDFRDLAVATERSAFVLKGRIDRDRHPTILDLVVNADRFAFQEWSGILTGLKNIAVEASFDARLAGPLARLATDLDLRSNAGNARGPFVLDTSVPGWRGVGSVELERLNLARWMNRPDRPSDITGRADFDLDLNLGRVPVGTYAFAGAHAGYLGYEGDRVRARGRIKTDEVIIEDAAADAYGAGVRLTSGSISFARPYAFRFQGTATRVDLRRVPASIPVPHVESVLAFTYDVTGQFASAFIKGGATFDDSEFLGARIGAGTTGTIDTSVRPIRYGGEGDLSDLDLRSFGAGLGVAWMQEPRYAGQLSGRFRVEGEGTDRTTMVLAGGGRLHRGDFFEGTLSDADVDVMIEQGSLRASFDGSFSKVNPAIPLNDERFAAVMSGSGRARFAVRDLLLRSPELSDYDIDASLNLGGTSTRGVQIDTGRVETHLAGGTLRLRSLQLTGPAVDLQASGAIELDGTRSSNLEYDIARANLAELHELLGRALQGNAVTKGRLTGPAGALGVTGDGAVARFAGSGINALTVSGSYDVLLSPAASSSPAEIKVTGKASLVEALNQEFQQVDGTISYAGDRLAFDVTARRSDAIEARANGNAILNLEQQWIDLLAVELRLQASAWQLTPGPNAPRVSWDEGGLTIGAMAFTGLGNADQRIAVSGTWREDGAGALQVNARRVFLDSFSTERPARYGGVVDAIATIGGTRDRPLVRADLTVTEGRVRQLAYQRLVGRVDYADEAMRIDVRLDQAPGVWLTAAGTVPLSLFDDSRTEQPMDLEISSSSIALGLIEGLTTVVRKVTGTMRLDLAVVGTSRDPHFTGIVEVVDAGFTVAASGSTYRNGRASLRLASEVVRVDAFHLEDGRGRTLDVKGSLGTHELKVGDLEIDATAKGFEVVRNEFGTVEVDALLNLRGRAESPRLEGTVTIVGGSLNVDAILDRTLFRPYPTESAKPVGDNEVDAIAALNPSERLGLGIVVRIPGTMRMIGDEVQVTAGTPIGLGDISLRVFGELFLYKDPGDQLYVNGSLDSLTGTYTFQGRRFDIDPTSSVNFHGDLNPELYITVQRLISGVDTRVAIVGPLREPELRLTSNPPLEPSDILSLIVFGVPANLLTDLQQRDLAIRAGTLAAGFLASPLVSALERTLGLEILEIEAPDDPVSGGPRVTIGDELLPGLVARFSRQFGREEYDEATIEYSLSRILRIRATFSDAVSLNARSPFRRTERAGIDLIFFFSF